MGAITTTLNLNGNMGNRLAALQRRAEMLYASMQKLGTLNVSLPENLNIPTIPTQPANAMRTLGQSAESFRVATENACRSCAMLSKGIRDIELSATKANRQVNTLSSSLKAFPTTLNFKFNGNPEAKIAKLQTGVESLKKSINGLKGTDISTPQSFGTFTNPLPESEARAIGTTTALKQSMLDLSKAIVGVGSVCAGAIKGIGNIGNVAQKTNEQVSLLTANLKRLNSAKMPNLNLPKGANGIGNEIQESEARAINTTMALRQSMLDLNKAVAGTRGACAEAAKGIKNISNSAQEANRRVSSLATNLNKLNRVRLPNLNTLPNNSAYAVLGNMAQSLMGSLDRVNSSLGRTNSALNSLGSSTSRANNALNGTSNASVGAARGIRNVGNAAQEAARHTSSLVASLTAAWAVYGAFHAARNLFETSDKLTSIEGRMMVGIDEGSLNEAKAYFQKNMGEVPMGVSLDDAAMQGAVAQYKKRIMDIANETRQKFTDTAGFISKLMVNVGGKAFKSTNELLDFTKTLNKFIVVSGASGSEATSILTQLPQALSSGNLQGDELKSIRENAPLLKNTIQDYANKILGLQGDIKDLGAEGKITARTIVDAVEWGAKVADEKLGKMPWTWAQRWNVFSNRVLDALEPVYGKMKQLANMGGMDKMLSDMANVVAFFADKVVTGVSVVMAFATALSNIGLLYPILTVGISAMAGALILLIGVKVKDIACGALQIAMENAASVARAVRTQVTAVATVVENIHTAAKSAGTMATIASTVADLAANAAKWLLVAACFALVGVLLALSPVLIAVGLLMFIYGVATKTAEISMWGLYVATIGVVAVVIMAVGALIAWIAKMVAAGRMAHSVAYYIGYLFGWLYGVIYNVIAHIWNVVAGFANFFYNVLDDPVQAWVNLIHDMVDDCLGFLQSLASGIDAVFGSNLAGAVANWKSRAQAAVSDIIGKKAPMKTIMNRMTYKDVAVTAGEAGRGLEKFTGEVMNKVGAIMDNLNGGYQGYDANAANGGKLDGIKGDTGRIAKATEKTAENLDWLITANERRAINAFTNHNYQVPVNVTINGNDRNLAGIAEEIRWNLTDYLTERLSSGAEGAVQGV